MIAEANTVGLKHLSLEKSVLVILKEKAILNLKDKEYTLKVVESKIVTGDVKHFLELIEDTEAAMPVKNSVKLLKE